MAVATVPVSSLPKGTGFSRFLMALGASRGSSLTAKTIAEHDRWRDTPQVAATMERWLTKAVTPAGSTSDATWASPLAAYGLADEALTILRSLSVFDTLAPKMQRVPLRTQLPHETGTGFSGNWVGEGHPLRFQKTSFESVLVEAFKFGKGTTYTQEMMRFSDPAAETTIRRTLLGGLARGIDQQFLDPAIVATANLNPASITNGAPSVTSTGSTAAAIAADLAAMNALITTAGGGLTWIMRRKTMGTVAAALGAMSGLPSTLWAWPVIVSDNSPAQITLVDAAGIVFADSDMFDVDVSTQATIQADDAPDDPPVAGSVMTSLWQQNLIAMKAFRWLAWKRIESGSVVYMTVAY